MKCDCPEAQTLSPRRWRWLNTSATKTSTGFRWRNLNGVTEAVWHERHRLASLLETGRKADVLIATTRSSLHAAARIALGEPILTASRLGTKFGAIPRAGLT